MGVGGKWGVDLRTKNSSIISLFINFVCFFYIFFFKGEGGGVGGGEKTEESRRVLLIRKLVFAKNFLFFSLEKVSRLKFRLFIWKGKIIKKKRTKRLERGKLAQLLLLFSLGVCGNFHLFFFSRFFINLSSNYFPSLVDCSIICNFYRFY